MTSPNLPKYFLLLLFLAVIVIATVNPRTIPLWLGGDPQMIGPKVKWPVLLFDLYLALLLLLWLVFRARPKARNLIINQVVLVASVLAVLVAAKTADTVLGKLRHNWDLVFLPNTSAHYETPEFDYRADINGLGFRGPKDLVDLGGNSYDVLMLGDSFTFGWGLTYEETWPWLVEQRLRAAGFKVRIFNLGKPGNSPIGYVEVARRAAPILKPDLIVVNILQGDDLFQLAPSRSVGAVRASPEGAGWSSSLRLRWYFRLFLPNLHGLFGGGIFGTQTIQESIGNDWIEEAKTILQVLTPEQRERFEALADTIKAMFARGWLNPKLVLDGILTPGRFFYYEDLDAPTTQAAIRNLGGKLRQIEEASPKDRCAVLVSLVPYTPYVSSICQRAWQGMGYALDDRLLLSNNSEAAIHEAAQIAGLDFYSPLAEFRKAAQEEHLYYEIDGHFNSAGAVLYAQFMTELLEARIMSAQGAGKPKPAERP